MTARALTDIGRCVSRVKLQINGEPREVPAGPEGLTILALLSHLEIAPGQVAVEVNSEVVRKALHAEHRLRAGDEVEIVTFVGGG